MSAKRDGKIALIMSVFMLFGLQVLFAASPARALDREIEGALSRYFDNVPVRVEVKAPGEVVLKGGVTSLADEHSIYEIASRVKGVKKLTMDIQVRPSMPMTDEQIKIQIVNGLKINSQILVPDNITVNVLDGNVTLAGKAQSVKEVEAAERVALFQMGVKGLESNIQVLSNRSHPLADQDVLGLVNGVIEDHFPLVKDKVKASVSGGHVVLNGMVTTIWEKDNLPREVKRVMGVKDVENHLAL